MSAAERTNESATKSAPASTASARSATSLSVIAGSSGRAKVTLIPLRGASGPGETTRASTSPDLHALDRQARDAVADHDLRALGHQAREVGEVDEDPIGIARSRIAGEDDRLARRHRALADVRRQPQLGPLQVEEQAQRPPGAPGRRAHLAGAAALIVGRPVRAVQPRAVDARGDHPVEHTGGVRGRAERGDDLRAPFEHAR